MFFAVDVVATSRVSSVRVAANISLSWVHGARDCRRGKLGCWTVGVGCLGWVRSRVDTPGKETGT